MTTPVGPARPLPANLPPVLERPPPRRPEAPPEAAALPPIMPNPSLRFEPTLGMVVFEVRDAAGEVTRSVPTERELSAYRKAALRGEDAPGQTRSPPGGSPSSPSALEVPAEGAPGPAAPDSPARLMR